MVTVSDPGFMSPVPSGAADSNVLGSGMFGGEEQYGLARDKYEERCGDKFRSDKPYGDVHPRDADPFNEALKLPPAPEFSV